MSDLIDRGELLKKETCLWDEALGTCACVLEEDINKAPTVDAVEVVRCKDCKNRTQSRGMVLHCSLNGMQTDDDDFCSYGSKG